MVNRIVKLVIGLLLTTAVSIGMVMAEGELNRFEYDNYSETFVGAISSETYSSIEETIKGFISTELTGASAYPVYRGYDKISDLTGEEIRGLAIDELIKDGTIDKIVAKYIK